VVLVVVMVQLPHHRCHGLLVHVLVQLPHPDTSTHGCWLQANGRVIRQHSRTRIMDI
jgi:hypothetical protein